MQYSCLLYEPTVISKARRTRYKIACFASSRQTANAVALTNAQKPADSGRPHLVRGTTAARRRREAYWWSNALT